jgi:predicted neuraminidase
MSTVNIAVGQVWIDLDERNAEFNRKTNKYKPREVEIVSLPTLSRKGVMRVIAAPNNKGSVGQLREFTRGKLLNHYGLVKS